MTTVSSFIEGTFGFVAYDNSSDIVSVAFRGSFDTVYWIDDMDYAMTAYSYGPEGAKVHEGFLRAYNSVADQVIDALKAYLAEHPTATIAVTGHSLGAAMATLAALDIKERLNP